MTPHGVPMALDSYLSVAQLAKRLGITRQWARVLVERGQLEAINTPLGWLIEPGSAAALAERRAAARVAVATQEH